MTFPSTGWTRNYCKGLTKLGEEECMNASTDASLAKAANECFRKKMSDKKFQCKLNR